MVQGECCLCERKESKKFLQPSWAPSKVCYQCYRKREREVNKEKIAKTKHENYLKNKESIQAKNKKWREENKEKSSEYHANYRKENSEDIKEYKKTYYQENRQQCAVSAANRYKLNKDQIIANKHKRRKEVRKANLLAQGVSEDQLEEVDNLDSIFEEVTDEV